MDLGRARLVDNILFIEFLPGKGNIQEIFNTSPARRICIYDVDFTNVESIRQLIDSASPADSATACAVMRQVCTPKRSWLLRAMMMAIRVYYLSTLGIQKYGLQRMAILLDLETFQAKLPSIENCDNVTQTFAMLNAEGVRLVVWKQSWQRGLPAIYGWRELGRDLIDTTRFWWNQLKFPGDRYVRFVRSGNPSPDETKTPAPTRPCDSSRFSWLESLGLICLFLVACGLLFRHLDYPLFEPDEARNSEIALTMLESGNWDRLELDGKPYWDKPPFLAWSVAVAYQLLGSSETTTRLPGVLSAVVTLLATWYFARRLGGALVAFLAATCLVLSTGFIIAGRFVTMDAMLTAAVTVTLYSAWLATSTGTKLRWHWWVVSAISCGIGVLIKGPVVAVLTVPVWIAYQVLTGKRADSLRSVKTINENDTPQNGQTPFRIGQWVRPDGWTQLAQRLRCWNLSLSAIALYVLIVCGLAGPWFIANGLRDPEFLSYYFWKHHVLRYSQAFNHQQPFWYYVPTLAVCLLPASLWFPIWIGWWWPNDQRRYLRRPEMGLSLLHVVWVLGFFSLSQSKIVTYVLPAVPSICILFGAALAERIRQSTHRKVTNGAVKPESLLHWVWITQSPISIARTSTLIVIGVLIALIWFSDNNHRSKQTWLVCASLSCAAWIIAEWRHYRRIHPGWTWGMVAIPCLCCVLLVTSEIVPVIALKRSIFADVRAIRANDNFATHPVFFFAHSSHASEFWFQREQLVHFEVGDIHRVQKYFQEHPYSVVVAPTDHLNILAEALGEDFQLMRYTDGRRLYVVQPKDAPVVLNASLEPYSYSAPAIITRRR